MFPTIGPFLMSINYLVSKTQQLQSSFPQYDSSRMESCVLASAPLLSMIMAKPLLTFKPLEVIWKQRVRSLLSSVLFKSGGSTDFKTHIFQIFAHYTQSVALGLFVEATCSPKEKDLFLKSFQNPLNPLAFWSVSEKQANEVER